MPAVRWETLRQEAQALAAASHDPASFINVWADLLERYQDRAFRPGQALTPPHTPGYHLPAAMLTGLWQVLRVHLEPRTELAIPLADALWERRDLESRLLAARLLGLADVEPPHPVLTRLRAWWADAGDAAVRAALLEHGTARLVNEAPAAYMEAVGQWLQDENLVFGLQALMPQINAPRFENLPRIIRYIEPLLSPPDPALRPELAEVLRAIVRRWPEEAFVFLRSLWVREQGDTLAWLIRRVLPLFPSDKAQALKEALES